MLSTYRTAQIFNTIGLSCDKLLNVTSSISSNICGLYSFDLEQALKVQRQRPRRYGDVWKFMRFRTNVKQFNKSKFSLSRMRSLNVCTATIAASWIFHQFGLPAVFSASATFTCRVSASDSDANDLVPNSSLID